MNTIKSNKHDCSSQKRKSVNALTIENRKKYFLQKSKKSIECNKKENIEIEPNITLICPLENNNSKVNCEIIKTTKLIKDNEIKSICNFQRSIMESHKSRNKGIYAIKNVGRKRSNTYMGKKRIITIPKIPLANSISKFCLFNKTYS